jgi:hypothetical protein
MRLSLTAEHYCSDSETQHRGRFRLAWLFPSGGHDRSWQFPVNKKCHSMPARTARPANAVGRTSNPTHPPATPAPIDHPGGALGSVHRPPASRSVPRAPHHGECRRPSPESNPDPVQRDRRRIPSSCVAVTAKPAISPTQKHCRRTPSKPTPFVPDVAPIQANRGRTPSTSTSFATDTNVAPIQTKRGRALSNLVSFAPEPAIPSVETHRRRTPSNPRQFAAGSDVAAIGTLRRRTPSKPTSFAPKRDLPPTQSRHAQSYWDEEPVESDPPLSPNPIRTSCPHSVVRTGTLDKPTFRTWCCCLWSDEHEFPTGSS